MCEHTRNEKSNVGHEPRSELCLGGAQNSVELAAKRAAGNQVRRVVELTLTSTTKRPKVVFFGPGERVDIFKQFGDFCHSDLFPVESGPLVDALVQNIAELGIIATLTQGSY